MTDPLDSVAASHLVSASVLAQLVTTLARKGVLTDSEVRETYEQALLMLEQEQGSAGDAAHLYALARGVIEEQLRAMRSPR